MRLQLRQIATVLRKELTDGLRDRRSVVSALLFPLLMPALITFLFNTLAERERQADDIDIPVVGAPAAPGLIAWIERRGFDVVEGPTDPQEAVRAGTHDFVLVIPEDYADDFARGSTAEIELVLDGSRKEAHSAIRRVRGLVRSYGRMVGALRLVARGVSPQVGHPVALEDVDVASARKRAATLFVFIPMFVILAAFMTGMHVAIDSTAGERERSSLEPLLVNPVPRTAVVLGKWLATVAFSGVGISLILTSLTLALQRMPLQELGLQLELGPAEIVGVLAATLPLAFFASGLQILVATFARSFKEAQTYVSMLIFLPMVPYFIASVSSLGTQPWMIPVPALGQQVLLTSVLGGEKVSFLSFLVSGSSSLFLGLLCVWVTARLFQRERIVFGR
jgi:sodium transport system permease protein